MSTEIKEITGVDLAEMFFAGSDAVTEPAPQPGDGRLFCPCGRYYDEPILHCVCGNPEFYSCAGCAYSSGRMAVRDDSYHLRMRPITDEEYHEIVEYIEPRVSCDGTCTGRGPKYLAVDDWQNVNNWFSLKIY